MDYGSSRFSATNIAEPCRKNPADLHIFAKIENLGIRASFKQLDKIQIEQENNFAEMFLKF